MKEDQDREGRITNFMVHTSQEGAFDIQEYIMNRTKNPAGNCRRAYTKEGYFHSKK